MKWLIAGFLWVVAIVLAVMVLRRVGRGKPIVLAGRWSPRVIRMVAIVLVMLGASEQAPSQETKGAPGKLPSTENNDQLPTKVNVATIDRWLYWQAPNSMPRSAKLAHAKITSMTKPTAEEIDAAKSHAKYLPKTMALLLLNDYQALKDGKPLPTPTLADLTLAFKEMETHAYYDHYWNAYLWRKATDLDVAKEAEWTTLFAGLRQNARITDLLIRTQATIKPVMLSERAWMSKAGPGPAERELMVVRQKSIAEMVKLAQEHYAATDEGTWKRDGVVLLKADKDSSSPVLIRAGQKHDFSTEFTTRIGRLDLLKSGAKPTAVLHDSLGKIEFPANTLVGAQTLPKYLNDGAKKKLEQLVQEALSKNSEEAADRLETMLPFAHEAMRIGLKETPSAKGAPRLRLIVALFDDVAMPELKPSEKPNPRESGAFPGGGGLGGRQ